MNSVAAAVTTDFHGRSRPKATATEKLRVARIATVVVGVAGTALALFLAGSDIKSLWDQFVDFLGLFGGGLGVAAAAATLQLVPMSVGAEAVTIAFQATGRLAVLSVFVSLLVGVLAGIPPAWHASRTDLVAALRGA